MFKLKVFNFLMTVSNLGSEAGSEDDVTDYEKTGDPGLDDMMETIWEVVGKVQIFLYFALAAVLVVKGAMLGVQIVKAADEPQVRQEKINSLKWLVIGIAVAYGVTIGAPALIKYFSSL